MRTYEERGRKEKGQRKDRGRTGDEDGEEERERYPIT